MITTANFKTPEPPKEDLAKNTVPKEQLSAETSKKPLSEKPKKPKNEAVPLDTEKAVYRHEGKSGMIVLHMGNEQFTNKPIERIINFMNHVYSTTDPEEIKLLDEITKLPTPTLYKFDEYKELVESQPAFIVMELNGKKMKVPVSALEDSYKEMFYKESDGSKEVKTNF